MPDIFQTILISLISGGFSGLVTFATMRNDIVWIKRLVFLHDSDIKELCSKVGYFPKRSEKA